MKNNKEPTPEELLNEWLERYEKNSLESFLQEGKASKDLIDNWLEKYDKDNKGE